jgi:hypothetical protein
VAGVKQRFVVVTFKVLGCNGRRAVNHAVEINFLNFVQLIFFVVRNITCQESIAIQGVNRCHFIIIGCLRALYGLKRAGLSLENSDLLPGLLILFIVEVYFIILYVLSGALKFMLGHSGDVLYFSHGRFSSCHFSSLNSDL